MGVYCVLGANTSTYSTKAANTGINMTTPADYTTPTTSKVITLSEEVKPALLTRAEIAFLRGQLNPSPDFAKALRYRIIKKLKIFLDLELPLLKEASKNWPNLEATLRPLVTTNSHLVTTCSYLQNNDLTTLILGWTGGDLNPRPPACEAGVCTSLAAAHTTELPAHFLGWG